MLRSTKNSCWDFERNCVKPAHQLWKNQHLHHMESSDPSLHQHPTSSHPWQLTGSSHHDGSLLHELTGSSHHDGSPVLGSWSSKTFRRLSSGKLIRQVFYGTLLSPHHVLFSSEPTVCLQHISESPRLLYQLHVFLSSFLIFHSGQASHLPDIKALSHGYFHASFPLSSSYQLATSSHVSTIGSSPSHVCIVTLLASVLARTVVPIIDPLLYSPFVVPVAYS